MAVASGIGAIAVLLTHLFVPSVVGMGDHSNGRNLACALGVANRAPFDSMKSTQYIYTSWVPHQWFGEACGAGGYGEPLPSLQSLLLWLAKLVTPLFGWGPGLDTRAVGILWALVFGILLMLFITQLPGRAGFRILIAISVTAIMDDGIFVDFFISPYGDPALFLGVFATLIALMFLWRPDTVRWSGIVLVTLACALTISAKAQMLSMLPVVAIALLWRPHRLRRRRLCGRRAESARRGTGILFRSVLLRMPALVAVIGLTGFTGLYAGAQPSGLSERNLYNAVFMEILPNSPEPIADLKWLGLPTGFASSSGTTMDSPNAAIYDAGYPAFMEKVNQEKIVLFYLAHPARLVSMADRGLAAIAHPVLGDLGSYTGSAGVKPWAKEYRVPLIEGISVVFAALPLLILALQVLTMMLAVAVASRRQLGLRATGFGRAVAFFVVALWAQFWAVMLSEGEPDIYKNMLVATFMSSLCLVFIPALIMLLWQPIKGSLPPPLRSNEPVEAVADAR